VRIAATAFLVLALAVALPGWSVAQPNPAASRADIALSRIAPPLVTREQWQAKPALPGLKPQKVTGIIVHHTAVRQNPRTSLEAKLRGLQAFSQKPAPLTPKYTRAAWPDNPYHYYVDVSGRIGEGRDVRFAGDTNTKYDTSGYAQVVIEGNFDQDTPTPAQLDAVADLVAWLMLVHNTEQLSVHKEHAQTSCPGLNLIAAMPKLRAAITERRRQKIAQLCTDTPTTEFARNYCRTK
jgi:hypothetical protein